MKIGQLPKNTSGLKVGSYYWFDLPTGWEVGMVEECSLYSNGVSVSFCGSDEIHELPTYCYTELIKKPEEEG